MAHIEQAVFVESVRLKYPEKFENQRVIEFGSLDINGSVRTQFTDCEYLGVDLAHGKGVDQISKCHEFEGSGFDTVISCEMLEHDPYWKKSIRKMYDVLNKGGLMVMTCATEGRHEHGTARTTPQDSPFTASWDYYMNLVQQDVEYALNFDLDNLFSEYEFSTNPNTKDLYFYGVKNKMKSR